MPAYYLTIIVPVFNESENLLKFREEMDKFLNQSPVQSIVLFINDGSTDGSTEIIKSICKSDPRYFYVSLEKNYGLSTAIKTGIDKCETELIGYIDADLQTLPVDFLGYFQYFPEYSLVNGIRIKRADSIVKKTSSIIANAFRRRLINDGITDTCCPLKILKTSVAKKLPFFNGMHRFIPALVKLQGEKVKQVPVRHFCRYAGKAKYKLSNRLVSPLVDTLAFVWMRNRNIRYQIMESNFSK